MNRADESRASAVSAAIIVSPAIAVVAVGLRLYTRVFLLGKRFPEDWCIALAMLFSIAMSICMGFSVIYGFGRHIETVSAQELVLQAKLAIPGIQLYIFVHMALKLSIMLQYVRISVMRFERYFCYTIIVILIAESIALAGTSLGLCQPFQALWTSNIPGAICLDRRTVYNVQLGFTIAMDFLVLISPLFILRHLSLPWAQKLLILIVLSFGGMACVISIVRFLTLTQSTRSRDPTFDKVPSAVYGVIEPNLGIFCASVVTLRPLLGRHLPSRLTLRLESDPNPSPTPSPQRFRRQLFSLRYVMDSKENTIATSTSVNNTAVPTTVTRSDDISRVIYEP